MLFILPLNIRYIFWSFIYNYITNCAIFKFNYFVCHWTNC